MTDHAPNLSQPLKNLLQGLAEQDPAPLLPMLTLFAQHPVTEEELLAFVGAAPPNDAGMIQLRLALAKWDANEDLELEDPHGDVTGSGSIARRVAVVKELGLSEHAEAVLRDKVPVHVQDIIVITRQFEPWYEDARPKRSTLYWDDYEKYLTQVNKWPAPSITTLDQSTDAVVERLSDPIRAEIKPTKGVVVGYVQSGENRELHRRDRQGHRRRLSPRDRHDRHHRDPPSTDSAPHRHGANGRRKCSCWSGSHRPRGLEGARLPAGRGLARRQVR
jgi:hypothetical protein